MTDAQKELINALASAWANHPKLRLCQLIEVARLSCQENRATLFYFQDAMLLKQLKDMYQEGT